MWHRPFHRTRRWLPTQDAAWGLEGIKKSFKDIYSNGEKRKLEPNLTNFAFCLSSASNACVGTGTGFAGSLLAIEAATTWWDRSSVCRRISSLVRSTWSCGIRIPVPGSSSWNPSWLFRSAKCMADAERSGLLLVVYERELFRRSESNGRFSSTSISSASSSLLFAVSLSTRDDDIRGSSRTLVKVDIVHTINRKLATINITVNSPPTDERDNHRRSFWH